VALISKLSVSRIELASIAFYAVSGIILLVFLFLTGYPPHLAFLGVLSLIVAFGVFTHRKWTPWINFILFAAASTFAIYTLISIGFSNAIVAVEMIVYVALTWVFAYYNLLKRKSVS
jgi:uncharacterized membrane protein (DUF2068 family)